METSAPGMVWMCCLRDASRSWSKKGRSSHHCRCATFAFCPFSVLFFFWDQVPDGVRFLTVKTDAPADTDVGCILLCPQNSEADFALDLLKKVCSAHRNLFLWRVADVVV